MFASACGDDGNANEMTLTYYVWPELTGFGQSVVALLSHLASNFKEIRLRMVVTSKMAT